MAAGRPGELPSVEGRHFEAAARRVLPSVSRKDRRSYDALRLRLRASRGHLQPDAAAVEAASAGAAAEAAGGIGGIAGVGGEAAGAGGSRMEGTDDANAPDGAD